MIKALWAKHVKSANLTNILILLKANRSLIYDGGNINKAMHNSTKHDIKLHKESMQMHTPLCNFHKNYNIPNYDKNTNCKPIQTHANQLD